MTRVLASRLSALRRRRSDELVPDAVIVGSCVGGLLAALAMGRAGHQVVLLERDHMAEAKDPEAAFAVERSGAPHIHQTHGFLSRLLVLLRERFQDVLTDLQAVGGFTLSMTKILGDERPGDEDLRVLVVRRSTFEWLLRRKVDSEPNITVRTGTGVVGLTTSGVDEAGRPIVSGVDLEDGGSVRAGVVIAATGHRGDIPGWLSGIGVACPESEHSSDLIYLTQWYRQSSPTRDDDPRLFGGLPYLRFLAVPGDGNTLSITLAVPSSDRELRRALLEPGSFERACRALPGPDRFFAPSSPSGPSLWPPRTRLSRSSGPVPSSAPH